MLGAFESFLTLLLAAALGAAVGFERRIKGHIAGPHTGALVAVGSAMYVVIAHDLAAPADVIRTVGQVAVGIGFLCGGTIIRNGLNIQGLNTAATLWCIGAIGSLIGAKFITLGIAATAAIVVINMVLHELERRVSLLRSADATTSKPNDGSDPSGIS